VKSVLETLRAVPFLAGLPEATLIEVAKHSVEKVHMRGDTIFLEGDQPKGLLVVREGAVKIFKVGDGGREQILEIEGSGRSVAELPLFDGRPYPASCAAVHDTVMLVVLARNFHELLDRHPDLSRAVIASLAFRLRRMVMLVQELSLRDVRQRLLDLFGELAKGGLVVRARPFTPGAGRLYRDRPRDRVANPGAARGGRRAARGRENRHPSRIPPSARARAMIRASDRPCD
jgi:CRP/FNR family transcriptional regulator